MTDTNAVHDDSIEATVVDSDDATLAHAASAQLHMLTTIDNPFNPFTDYDRWRAYDEGAGYYTSAFLARIAITSSDLSEADQDIALENAIDEIVKENVLGLYTKVSQTS